MAGLLLPTALPASSRCVPVRASIETVEVSLDPVEARHRAMNGDISGAVNCHFRAGSLRSTPDGPGAPLSFASRNTSKTTFRIKEMQQSRSMATVSEKLSLIQCLHGMYFVGYHRNKQNPKLDPRSRTIPRTIPQKLRSRALSVSRCFGKVPYARALLLGLIFRRRWSALSKGYRRARGEDREIYLGLLIWRSGSGFGEGCDDLLIFRRVRGCWHIWWWRHPVHQTARDRGH